MFPTISSNPQSREFLLNNPGISYMLNVPSQTVEPNVESRTDGDSALQGVARGIQSMLHGVQEQSRTNPIAFFVDNDTNRMLPTDSTQVRHESNIPVPNP